MRISASLFLVAGALGACSGGGNGTIPGRVVTDAEIEPIAPAVHFSGVRDLVVDSTAIWVLDGAPPFLTRVSLDGSTVRRFGAEGRGPGELADPIALQPAGDVPGGIVVWDLGNHRVLSFAGDGTLVDGEGLSERRSGSTRANIRSVTYADPLRIRRLGRGFVTGIFPFGVNRTADIAGGALYEADRRLEPRREPLVRFADLTSIAPGDLREFLAVPLWDACEGGASLVVWNADAQRLDWLDDDGSVTGSADLSIRPREIRDADIQAYLRAMARLELGAGYQDAGIDFQAMAHDVHDRFAARSPAATDLRCEAPGAAWLRMFDTAADPRGGGARWLRVDARGSVRGFEFPKTFIPMAFTTRGPYGLREDAQGEQSLARWWELSTTAYP